MTGPTVLLPTSDLGTPHVLIPPPPELRQDPEMPGVAPVYHYSLLSALTGPWPCAFDPAGLVHWQPTVLCSRLKAGLDAKACQGW